MTSTTDRAATRPDVRALDPVFAQMGAATFRHAGEGPELSDREKSFLRIVADVCQSTFGLAFELHVHAALACDVTTADLRALLRLVAYDTGYHAALEGIARLAEIETALGLPRPEAEPLAAELLETGPDAVASPLPESIRADLSALDPHFLEHFLLQSRMRLPEGPGTLSVRERAFATMSVDVHYQTLEETFAAHIGRALGSGASAEDVRAVLRFNAQFGVTRAWRAWKALNAHLAVLAPAA